MQIQVNEISKVYGAGENKVVALSHTSMAISDGDFISIMGPSGSGKSTLLHIISGLDKPASGSVLYGDTDIHHGPDKKLSAFRRRKIGFIFQQFNLLPVLTARENIIMPLLLDKKQLDEAYLQELSSFLGNSCPAGPGKEAFAYAKHSFRRTAAARGDCEGADRKT